jgi:hypothetical protein
MYLPMQVIFPPRSLLSKDQVMGYIENQLIKFEVHFHLQVDFEEAQEPEEPARTWR